jgi:hypothetical protein
LYGRVHVGAGDGSWKGVAARLVACKLFAIGVVGMDFGCAVADGKLIMSFP